MLFVHGYQELIAKPLFCLFPIGIGIGIVLCFVSVSVAK
jgi:hypothetical protein